MNVTHMLAQPKIAYSGDIWRGKWGRECVQKQSGKKNNFSFFMGCCMETINIICLVRDNNICSAYLIPHP